MCKNDELKVIVPISIDAGWPTKQEIVDTILEQYNDYGIKNYILSCPTGGFRAIGYPSKERYLEFANFFKEIKESLSGYEDIELAWWNCLTIKNGGSFERIVKTNGEEHKFSSCPLDPAFIKRFSEDVAMFASVAKPSFILFEDDYSMLASSGCYCERHLKEFARRMGKYYTREEVLANCHAKNEEGIEFTKHWRKLRRDSLVGIAEALRKELDKESPEIPMGYAQSGYAMADGDVTEPIARALAGKNHRPFVRFHGTGYGFFDQRKIPEILYSPLFEKQRLPKDFIFYHESDTFPHIKFYRAGKQMRALMANAFSFGYDGSLFICNQILDDKTEETTFDVMYKTEKKRFDTVSRLAKMCEIRGVELHCDTFYNTLMPYDGSNYPYWSGCIGRFGIPVSTKDEPVVFWDVNNVRFCDDETIKKNLSKVIVLDGLAAQYLTKMGYSKYIGVKVGEPVLDLHERLRFDLGAREVICEPYRHLNKGKQMHPAHMYSPDGMGEEYDIKVTDNNTKVVTELISYDKSIVIPAMTYFENSLGGKVIVYGTSVTYENRSQSLFNYRRQKLFQHFIETTSDEYVIVKNVPDVYVVQNEAKNASEAGFTAMLTLTNLCDDDLEKLNLVLPAKYRNKTYLKMNEEGGFEPVNVEITENGITLCEEFSGLEVKYILIK